MSVFGSLHFTKPLGVCMQLREKGLQLVDIDVQDSLEELAANFLEPCLQVWNNSPPLARSLDDEEPVIAGITFALKKPARLKPVHEPRDLALVPAHGLGQFPGGGFSFFRAMHEHGCFLRRHSEFAETAIEGCLQSYAGSKEPRNGKLCLPFPDAHIAPARFLPSRKRIPKESPVFPSRGIFRHWFDRRDFLGQE